MLPQMVVAHGGHGGGGRLEPPFFILFFHNLTVKTKEDINGYIQGGMLKFLIFFKKFKFLLKFL